MAFFVNTKTNAVSEFDPQINKQLLNEFMIPIPEATTLAQARTYAGQAGGYKGRPYTRESINTGAPLVISSDTLGDNSFIIPPRPIPTSDGSADIGRGQGILSGFTQGIKEFGDLESAVQRIFSQEKSPDYLASIGKTQDQVAQEELTAQQGVIQARASQRAAEAELRGTQAEIQAIVDKSKADSLKLEQQASQGQVTTPILTRQQAEVNRQAAIQVLPLQSKALAQQAKIASLGGNLEEAQATLQLARGQLDRAFTLQADARKEQIQYRRDMQNKIWEYLTTAEKNQLDKLQKEDTRQGALLKDATDFAQALSLKALESSPELIADFGKLLSQSPKVGSASFEEDLRAWNEKVGVLGARLPVKAEKAMGDIAKFKSFFPNVDITKPEGYKQFLNFKAQVAEAERKPLVETPQEISKALSGEFGNIIKSASNLVGAERGKTSRETMSSAINSGDFTSAYAQVANNVEESLTGTSKSKFSDSRTDYAVMLGLKDAIQNYADAGGDMGLLTGKAEDIKRKLGIDSGKASELAVQLWREFQSYRVNMTGAAFSVAESRDYASVNPTLGKSLNLNLSVINGALNQLENRITSTINTRVPGASNLYKKVSNAQDGLSDDDAYEEYKKLIGK